MRRVVLIAAAAAIAASQPASAAWHQPSGGPSPINDSASRDAFKASLTAVDGVPYVAWYESDGTNNEVRVARLTAAGTAWEKVAGSSSPINESPTRNVLNPSLAAINGVPYVAWAEPDSLGWKIRVARLNAAGTAWEKVADAGSPINEVANRDAFAPSLIGINGVPYVAWYEYDGTNQEIRVARLNATGTAWEKVADSPSPINRNTNFDALNPSLTAIAGVPYVAWSENDGSHTQIRVARLNAAGTAWDRIGTNLDPNSPINQVATFDARHPSLTAIGGVPYVAWEEDATTSIQIRAARLNAEGTGWERIGTSLDPNAPINESPDADSREPSLTAIDGVPYVAWREEDANNIPQIRVARLNAAGTGWEKVAGSSSPINERQGDRGFDPSLTSISGVPYVAWEEQDGTNEELRVSRLEPEFTSQTAVADATSATLSATWRTYGIQFPIGFEYGSSLERSTTPVSAPPGVDSPTITQEVSGLAPSTSYQTRSFATAGVAAPRLFAPVAPFTTATPTDNMPPETTITKAPENKLDKTKAKYKFTSSEPNSTFTCKFDRKKAKPCDFGKAKFKHLDDGKHKFRVIATDDAGNSDSTPAKDKFKVV
jgi:hypothetical protein